MVDAMLEAVAFTMDPITDARRARVIRSPVSRTSIIVGAERRSPGLHERNQP
jgi:hypothetical protein